MILFSIKEFTPKCNLLTLPFINGYIGKQGLHSQQKSY